MGPPVLLGTLPTAQTARGSGPLGGPCRTQALSQAAEPPCDAPRAASFAVQTGPKHRVASTSASTAPPTTGPALGPSIPRNPRRRPCSLHSPPTISSLGVRANPQKNSSSRTVAFLIGCACRHATPVWSTCRTCGITCTPVPPAVCIGMRNEHFWGVMTKKGPVTMDAAARP